MMHRSLPDALGFCNTTLGPANDCREPRENRQGFSFKRSVDTRVADGLSLRQSGEVNRSFPFAKAKNPLILQGVGLVFLFHVYGYRFSGCEQIQNLLLDGIGLGA